MEGWTQFDDVAGVNVASGLAEGQLLAGKYRVERVLGQGGMGVVIAARHIHLEERVAIKLMLAEAAFNHEAVARFVREARAAARLESAHVAKVSDVGTLEDGRPYMVMEYLDGADLSQVLQSSGPLAVQDAVDYLLQAGEAVAEAHSLGIVHRDLKPANLFLTRRRDRTPHVKVLDFGISKVAATSATDNAMTRTSALMGSPLYMSPEQMTSVRDVDARSDIWALGIILFELLTGAPPFVGDTLPQVCGLVIQTEAPLASTRRSDLPPGIDAVIQRCLAKQPADRFQNVAEVAQALQPFAGRNGRSSLERILLLSGRGEVASVREPRPPTQLTEAAKAATNQFPGTHAAWGDTRPPAAPAQRGKKWLAGAAVALSALGAGGWWLTKPSVDALPAASSASGAPVVELPAAEPPSSPASSSPSPSPSPSPAPELAPAAAATPASSPHAEVPPAPTPAMPNRTPRSAPPPDRATPSTMKSASPAPTPRPLATTAIPSGLPASSASPEKATSKAKSPAGDVMGGRL